MRSSRWAHSGGSPAPHRRRARAAYGLIAVVTLAAIGIGYLNRGPLLDEDRLVGLLPWLIATLAAELLWVPTLTGRATSSMASTVNFAALFILGPERALWVVAPVAGVATVLIQRRPLIRGLYNMAQMAITIQAAGWFATKTGGCPAGFSHFQDPGSLVPFLNAGIIYFALNTGLVAAIIAIWEGQPFLRAWRENFGYADDLVTSLALFLLSPLMVLGFLAAGPAGLAFLFLPMLLVRNAAARYIQLHETQEHLLWNERMAAMGEMAAEIGHELSNVLQVITARTQMLLTDEDGVRGERPMRAVRVIFERAADMRRLTKGLMDFSHHTVLKRRERVNELVRDAVDFVHPQNRYDRIHWEVDLDPAEPEADLDAVQLRQVLLNLFRNAAEAMAEAETAEPRIEVSTRAQGGWIEIKVRDNGPGIDDHIRGRVFDPWFTTKVEGHGFGLAVSYRIIRAHGGTIAASRARGGGAEIQIRLPSRAPAWRAAA